MINFDSLTLYLFKKEVFNFFIGAKVQKIQQAGRYEFIFYIRNIGETRKFYVNINPNTYHICFMTKETEEKRNIVIPKTAPMFCMLLRKYIQNCKIVNIEVPDFERIFEIYFEYYNELNEKSVLCLSIELMGKYSNIILYNYDTNVIIGCAHNVSSEKSRERELYGSLPYVYPSKQKKYYILDTDFQTFKNLTDINNIAVSVSSNFHYLTASFVQDLTDTLIPFSLEKLYEKLRLIFEQQEFFPCIADNYSKYYVINFINTFPCNSINSMIDEYFSYHQNRQIIQNLQSKIIKAVDNKLNKLLKLENKQKEQISKIEKADEYKEKADLIMANLYYIKSGEKKILLKNFEGNDIEIILDENKSPVENANKYYSLYKKIKSSYEHSIELLKDTKSQILYFEEIKFYVSDTENVSELENIYKEIYEEKQENTQEKINIEFVNYENYKIYIGKNKKQNDYILSKISTSEDIWFHPLNAPGAHVIVKNNNPRTEIPDNVILKAAQLTKEYSAQKNNSKTSIIYTKRKYVKKSKGKLAFVTYQNESEIIV